MTKNNQSINELIKRIYQQDFDNADNALQTVVREKISQRYKREVKKIVAGNGK